MSNELVLLRRIEELEKLIMRQPEIGGVWKDWTPTFPTGTMYITSPTIEVARYSVVGNVCFLQLQFYGALSGTTDSGFIITGFPIAIQILEAAIMTSAHSTGWGNKANIYTDGITSNLYIRTEDYSNMDLGASKYFRINCFGIIN